MKTYGGVDVYTRVFLTSALVGGEWSASRPGHFTPGERDPGTRWIGGWMGPGTVMDYMEKGKSFPYRDSNSDLSTVRPVTNRYTD
jgi:hypothetical protein